MPDTFHRSNNLAAVDPEIFAVIQKENQRQEDHIELIASENYTSPAVMEAQGSQLTNKYAEGYPGKRYYGGCEFVDIAETLALDRVRKLFGADTHDCHLARHFAGRHVTFWDSCNAICQFPTLRKPSYLNDSFVLHIGVPFSIAASSHCLNATIFLKSR